MKETRNELVKAVTAFDSWEAMVKSMTEHGYVPTIHRVGHSTKGLSRVRAKQQQKWNERRHKLQAEILKAGYRYFDGSKIIG